MTELNIRTAPVLGKKAMSRLLCSLLENASPKTVDLYLQQAAAKKTCDMDLQKQKKLLLLAMSFIFSIHDKCALKGLDMQYAGCLKV